MMQDWLRTLVWLALAALATACSSPNDDTGTPAYPEPPPAISGTASLSVFPQSPGSMGFNVVFVDASTTADWTNLARTIQGFPDVPVGTCVRDDTTIAFPQTLPTFLDPGTLTLATPGGDLALAPAVYGYATQSTDPADAVPSAVYRLQGGISTPGSGQVGAFDVTFRSAASVELAEPDLSAPVTVPAGQGLALAWSTGATPHVFVTLGPFQTAPYGAVCKFGDTGSAFIPPEAFQDFEFNVGGIGVYRMTADLLTLPDRSDPVVVFSTTMVGNGLLQ